MNDSRAKKALKTAVIYIVSAPFAALILALSVVASLQFVEESVNFVSESAAIISYSPLKKLIPGPSLPGEIETMGSNNNLDAIQFGGLYYVAFRTAPTHFASEKSMLYVMSSPDRKNWSFEAKFHYGKDVREPRFMAFKGKLFLYFFTGGANPLAFEPDMIHATERAAPGEWSEPKAIYEPGFVVWRAKEHDGKALMSVYYGSALYADDTTPGSLRLLESGNGYDWKMVGGKEVTDEISAEEGEFEFDAEGNLYATIRLEHKGGKVCRAEKDSLADWECEFTPYKYDSALMFRRGDDFYVVARRSLDGPFHKDWKLVSGPKKSLLQLARYSLTRKRTAVYLLDKENLALKPLFDFPSKGDTGYAGIVPLDEKNYWLLNYSSPIDGTDWSWIFGQLTGTAIYETTLRVE